MNLTKQNPIDELEEIQSSTAPGERKERDRSTIKVDLETLYRHSKRLEKEEI